MPPFRQSQAAGANAAGFSWRLRSCGSGYSGITCTDINECATVPACLSQNAQTELADDALAAIDAPKGAAYCAGSEPLAP